jgi:hypothetical protein
VDAPLYTNGVPGSSYGPLYRVPGDPWCGSRSEQRLRPVCGAQRPCKIHDDTRHKTQICFFTAFPGRFMCTGRDFESLS